MSHNKDHRSIPYQIFYYMNMLEYCKLIMSKVSFDQKLKEKEYRKALKLLTVDEAKDFTYWYTYESKQPDRRPVTF